MASAKGHPFWLRMLEHVATLQHLHDAHGWASAAVLPHTGPLALGDVLHGYLTEGPAPRTLERGARSTFGWNNGRRLETCSSKHDVMLVGTDLVCNDDEGCGRHGSQGFAVHYKAGSWLATERGRAMRRLSSSRTPPTPKVV